MLFFAAWLFIQLPIFSQETQSPAEQGIQAPEQGFPVVAEDPLRTAEQAISIGEGNAGTPLAFTSSIRTVLQMILVLALTAAAIYGIVFFIKKSAKPAAASDPFLKILATAHLGSNRYAHIVSVGSRAWLLGSSDGGVNLISEVEDKEVIDAMLLEDSRKSAQTGGRFPDFLSMLRRLGAPAESRTSGTDEIRKRREKLKGL